MRASKTGIEHGLLEHVHRSPLGVAVLHGETQIIRYANPAFRDLCHVHSDGVVGLAVADAIAPPGVDALVRLLGRVHETGQSQVEVELEQRTADGAIVGWQVTSWRVGERLGSSKDLVLQIRDATSKIRERHDREELMSLLRTVNERLLLASLREQDLTEKAEAANKSKSIFLATMSHELRTPLNAIIGYEELLAEGVSGSVTRLQRDHLFRIKRSANHLLTLIDQILTMARIEADREQAQCAPVAIADLLDWAVTLISPLAAAKGLKFSVQPPDHELTLVTDETKVRQILVNLLGNAVKFTDRGEVELAVHENEQAVHFDVCDTGIGIRSSDAERVFDSFWQVEQKHSRVVGGSGLGLSVSRRLARLLGGDVTLEGNAGGGSIFSLVLPRQPLHFTADDDDSYVDGPT